MKTASVWLRPTRASPACKYSYDPEKVSLTVGKRFFSDCGVWMTNFEKDIVVDKPGKDICPLCKLGYNVAPAVKVPVVRRTPALPFQHLFRNA